MGEDFQCPNIPWMKRSMTSFLSLLCSSPFFFFFFIHFHLANHTGPFLSQWFVFVFFSYCKHHKCSPQWHLPTPLLLSDISSFHCQDLLWSLWHIAVCMSLRQPEGPLTRRAFTKLVSMPGVMSLPFESPDHSFCLGSASLFASPRLLM